MRELLNNFQKQNENLSNDAQLLTNNTNNSDNNDGVNSVLIKYRSNVTFLRNIMSSLVTVAAEVSSFIHPYLADVLTTVLPVYLLADVIHSPSVTTSTVNPLLNDVTRDLPRVILQVSPRLAVPILLTVTPTLTGEGHTVAYQFAKLLISIFQHVERNHVVAHMSDLCSLVVLFLDYRRVYFDSSHQCADTEDVIIDMCIELCIKFTETELKSFLAQLIEWKDVDVLSNDNNDEITTAISNTNQTIHKKRPFLIVSTLSEFKIEKYARNIIIYHFLSKLGDKLKIIFTPLMASFWDDATMILEKYYKQIKDINEFIITTTTYKKDSKSAKKIKSKNKKLRQSVESNNDEDEEVPRDDDDDNNNGVEENESVVAAKTALHHLTIQASYVLTSVALTCTHDNDNFIDEQIFEVMMPQLSPLITIREAFTTDESYLKFMNEHVSYACVALTHATVGSSRDVLWKPLNHKILLACRDSRSVVRLAAINLLFDMFHDVGEDYLSLLPECLPFVSELMEDDHEDVCRRTHDTVKLIEDISGEKIDSYLS